MRYVLRSADTSLVARKAALLSIPKMYKGRYCRLSLVEEAFWAWTTCWQKPLSLLRPSLWLLLVQRSRAWWDIMAAAAWTSMEFNNSLKWGVVSAAQVWTRMRRSPSLFVYNKALCTYKTGSGVTFSSMSIWIAKVWSEWQLGTTSKSWPRINKCPSNLVIFQPRETRTRITASQPMYRVRQCISSALNFAKQVLTLNCG
mmetsp:Transcript_14593/g.27366  ORF Transcript_14593/g.27366 Transcript_14593/m.27366 type:complete len:200 (-) Transcript_14593:1133-1732(-)